MKVMILAAGRGERMGTLTEQLPKPLLPIGDKPIIGHLLTRLAQQGFKEIVINISYLAEKIRAVLGTGEQYGVTINYSYEAAALETAGGIYQALPLLGPEPFMAMSGDLWTDYPFAKLLKQPTRLAHLVMVDNPWHNPTGDFYLAADELSLTGAKKLNYAGIGVYHPDFFKDCQPGAAKLGPLFQQAIAARQMTGEYYAGEWVNIGTPAQLNSLLHTFRHQ